MSDYPSECRPLMIDALLQELQVPQRGGVPHHAADSVGPGPVLPPLLRHPAARGLGGG